MDRRSFLASLSASLLPGLSSAVTAPGRQRLGVTSNAYLHRWLGRYSSFKVPPFQGVLDLMDYVQGIGIGSVQTPVAGWTRELARDVKQTSESYGMKVLGTIRLPANAMDLDRFEREMRVAREAGIQMVCAALGRWRYEQFGKRADYEQWKAGAVKSIERAEPVARRLQMKVAIENHMDWTLPELLATLRGVASEAIGACVDVGSGVALLEDPMQVVRQLAPYAMAVHLKDMAVRSSDRGFHMSEVPLGSGCLDLLSMMEVLRESSSDLHWHLDVATKEPLEIPCLDRAYWDTLPEKSGADLAWAITWVREHEGKTLPQISSLSKLALLNLEEENVLTSLVYAGDALGFAPVVVSKDR